jgi:hypothetical protein
VSRLRVGPRALPVAGLLSALLLVGCSAPESEPPSPEPEVPAASPGPVTAAASPQRLILFAPGLFCDEDTSDAQLKALEGSGFTTVVLFTLRIQEEGDLRSCNRPAVTLDGKIADGINPGMPEYLQKLRDQGVETILHSISAGGPPAPVDFIRAQNLLATEEGTETLTRNLQVWADFLGIDGFDFDDEEAGVDTGGPIEPATLATLAEILAPMGQKHLLTADPSFEPSTEFWLQVMAQIQADEGQQLMSWMNLQTYGGAIPPDWIQAMTSFPQPIGVTDFPGFLVAGFSAELTGAPSDVCSNLTVWKDQVSGGMLWNMNLVEQGSFTFADYSQALVDGLAGNCSN